MKYAASEQVNKIRQARARSHREGGTEWHQTCTETVEG